MKLNCFNQLDYDPWTFQPSVIHAFTMARNLLMQFLLIIFYQNIFCIKCPDTWEKW